jgi:methionyl-tRNA synthetase
VNGKPHVGYALEAVQADVLARAARLRGDEVVFNIGTDEHGQKIFQKAEEEGITPQAYCDRMSEYFRAVKDTLDISYTHFIRTTDMHHITAAQAFWKRCDAAGDIYKKQYQTKYCVGCELEKTDSDLDHGKCPDHPNMAIETVDEENYFFRFSKYQDALLALYDARPDFVVPVNRQTEIRNFVAKGLQDFSISRLKSKMPWGIAVPGDEDHVMYVWFDALVNYISTLGFSEDEANFKKFWPGLQIAGKDNLRQQSAMWQAMLLSADLEPSKQILIHGHIMVAGQKMSKSLGNVISPDELIEKFGKDGTRYLLLSSGNLEHDPDITMERLQEKYNADLANGLGNLISRVLKLSEKLSDVIPSPARSDTRSVSGRESSSRGISDGGEKRSLHYGRDDNAGAFPEELQKILKEYKFADAMEYVMGLVREANKYIDDEKPWELVKTDQARFDGVMKNLLASLARISGALEPLLPETSAKIFAALAKGQIEPLFVRIK